MTSVQEFVRQNAPIKVFFTSQELKSAAKAAGLKVVEDSSHPDFSDEGFAFAILTKWGPETEERVVGRRAFGREVTQEFPVWEGLIFAGKLARIVEWVSKVGDNSVTYIPFLWGFSSSRGSSDQLVRALGIEPVTIQTPEPIVKMPAPSWVSVWSEDQTAGIAVSYAFLSEAKRLRDKFFEELNALLS